MRETDSDARRVIVAQSRGVFRRRLPKIFAARSSAPALPREAQRVFPPRLTPRDAIDALIGLPLGLFVGCVLSGLCAATFVAIGLDPLWGVLAFISPVLLVVPIGLRRVTLSDFGLELERYGGSHFRIAWEQVRGVRSVTLGEMLLASLTTPHRICTMCLSYRDHCRVDYAGGCFYFPPHEPAVFMAAVERELRLRCTPEGVTSADSYR